MTKNGQWQTLSSKYVHKNPWFKVRQDTVVRPNGKDGEYNVVESGRGVMIVPVMADEKVVLVRIFRYTTQREGWELPSGGIEKDEDPLVAAKRELQEETGYASEQWRELGEFDSMNGMSDAAMRTFEARNITPQGSDEQAEEGITEVRAFTPAEVVAMIKDGRIIDALSMAALLQFLIHKSDDAA